MNIFDKLPYSVRYGLGSIPLVNRLVFSDADAILDSLRKCGMVETITNMSAFGRSRLHFDLGRNIRNHFLLWHPKNPYTMQKLRGLTAAKRSASPAHPDNYSWSIISRLIVESNANSPTAVDTSEKLMYSLMARTDDSLDTLNAIGDAVEHLVDNNRFDLLDDAFSEIVHLSPSPAKLQALLEAVSGFESEISVANFSPVAELARRYGVSVPDKPES